MPCSARPGVVRVETIEELFDVGEVLAHQPVPTGRRVAIVGNAGGPGVLAADACISHGLEVPEFSADLQSALAGLLPPGASVRNPIDLAASATAEGYSSALGALLASDEIDAVIVIFTPPLVTRADDVAHAVVGAVDTATAEECDKPVVASFLGAGAVRPILHSASRPVPCFAYPENAARALAHCRHIRRVAGSAPRRRAGARKDEAQRSAAPDRRRLSEWVGLAHRRRRQGLLAAYGIAVGPTSRVQDGQGGGGRGAAARVPRRPQGLGSGDRPQERQSVVCGSALDGPEAVRPRRSRRWRTALGDAMEGAVIQPMVGGGVETIVGFVQDARIRAPGRLRVGRDSRRAPGRRGRHVLAPLTDLDARDMVLGLARHAAPPRLPGQRPPVDIDALVDVVLRLGRLAEDLPEIAEVDCNPVIATPAGALVVDARFRVSTAPLVDNR